MLTIYDPDGTRYLKAILRYVIEQRGPMPEHNLELEAAIQYLKAMVRE